MDLTAPSPHSNAIIHGPLIAAWLTSYASTSTRSAYRMDLTHYIAVLDHYGIDLLAARRSHVNLFARLHAPQDALTTLPRRLAAISAFYRYAASKGLVPSNPAGHVRRPVVNIDHSTTECLTHAEAVRYLDAARSHSRQAYALALLLLTTGLRISEALRTTESDLGTDRLVIRRKGGKQTVVPLPEALRIVLRELTGTPGTELTRGGKESRPIFRTGPGKPWVRTDAARTLQMISNRARLEKVVTPHVLRHTHATLALEHRVARLFD